MKVYKVISHAIEKGKEQDPYLTFGNELADYWAGEAAARVQQVM